MKIKNLINDLDEVVRKYHSRNGTYCFHYDGFELHTLGSLPKGERNEYFSDKTRLDSLGEWDYLIKIYWHDNSFSLDSYWVTLNEISEFE